MKILYVAGIAHSGSTYTARVLNQHSRLFSAGELEYLNERVVDGYSSCSCVGTSEGENSQGCEFWQELMEPLVDEIIPDRTARVSLDRNREWLKAIYQEKVAGVDPEFERGNRLLFERISEFTDSPVVIDASKEPWRLIPLKAVFGEDLYVLHILKHPVNQLVSRVNRGQNFYRAAFMKYLRRNLVYSWKYGSEPTYRRLRFEEFVESPEQHLGGIFSWLDLDFEDPFEKEQQLYHHLSGSDATASTDLPEPDPERVNKEEPDWSALKRSIVQLLGQIY